MYAQAQMTSCEYHLEYFISTDISMISFFELAFYSPISRKECGERFCDEVLHFRRIDPSMIP